MRISFDLDDTLIIGKDYSQKKNKRKLISGEFLREGTLELLNLLSKEHEIYIYTTSYRSPLLLKFAFLIKGIKIKKIINNTLHNKILKKYDFSNPPSKYPPHFAIDVHIDDSLGVQEEGKRYGFKVIQISPTETEWSNKILKIIKKL